MKRKDFEYWLHKNRYETVHCFGRGYYGKLDFTYTPKTNTCPKYHYGVFKDNGSWSISSKEYGERGYNPNPEFFEEGFDTEEEALDELKMIVENHLACTYAASLEQKIYEFSVQVMMNRYIEVEERISGKQTLADIYDLLKKYFPKDYYIYVNVRDNAFRKRYIRLYSLKFHKLIFEIECIYDCHSKEIIPVIISYDNAKYFRELNNRNYELMTYQEVFNDESGIYILYHNSLIAFEKYSYDGEIIYRICWNRDLDLRGVETIMKFMELPSGDENYRKHIIITNGIGYAIFDRISGKLINTFNTRGMYDKRWEVD